MNEVYENSPKSPIEQLRELGAVVELGQKYEEFSGPVNISEFTGLHSSAIKSIERAHEECLTFLEAPKIRDSFTDHEERRKWRSGLNPELNSFYNNNKLRLNVISSLFNKLNLVKEWFKIEKPTGTKAEKLNRIIDLMPVEIHEWANLSVDQKDEVLEQLDAICVQFLTTLQSD